MESIALSNHYFTSCKSFCFYISTKNMPSSMWPPLFKPIYLSVWNQAHV